MSHHLLHLINSSKIIPTQTGSSERSPPTYKPAHQPVGHHFSRWPCQGSEQEREQLLAGAGQAQPHREQQLGAAAFSEPLEEDFEKRALQIPWPSAMATRPSSTHMRRPRRETRSKKGWSADLTEIFGRDQVLETCDGQFMA